MDPNQYPVNTSLPSLAEATFHNQHAIGRTAHSTFFSSQDGYALGDGLESVLGSPFPQFNHVDRSITPPAPLHSPGFAKPGFLPFDVSPNLELCSPASPASGMAYGRRAGISHPRPISHARSPMVQPMVQSASPIVKAGGSMEKSDSHMVKADSPMAPPRGATRTRTPVPRNRTPLSATITSGNSTPGPTTNAISANPTPDLLVETPTGTVVESPVEGSTPRTEDAERTLKRLAAVTASWPLADLALKVKMVETGHLALRTDPFLQALSLPGKNDRASHFFGMAWLQRATVPSPNAEIPRTRFYARYAEVCADYNLSPMTPATFGRLVRILNPTLKTRRLGGRGKSKYHYCGLGLVGTGTGARSLLDLLQAHTPPFSASLGLSPGVASPAVASKASVTPRSTQRATPGTTPGLTPGTTPGLTPGMAPGVHSPFVRSNSSGTTTEDVHAAADSGSVAIDLDGILAVPSSLKYVPSVFASIDAVDALAPLALPSIYPYLSKELEVDCDIADTLHLLYRVHCALVFESIRFLKVDRLPSLFEALPGVMTVPVLKLFTTDQVADWVCNCDLVTYRAVIKMLARLQLQPVSPEIMTPLKALANGYVNHMSTALHYKLPKAFVTKKLKAARPFISLVQCLVRCIESGTAASGILSSRPDRNAMLSDWLQLDMNDLVLREFPCALENPTIFSEILEKSFLELLQGDFQEPPLPKFAAFLFGLPARFPNTSPWLFSLVLSNFLTACLREMSFGGANSFGRWWLVRCWVDEYFSWCFQLGGFLYDDLNVKAELSDETSGDLMVDKENSFIDLMEGIYGDSKPENSWT